MSLSGNAGRTLTIYLAADSNRFKRGMKDAETATTGLRGKLGKLGTSLKSNLGPALAGAGIAAAGAAVKFGVDGVKAAIEDQKAAERLATTMQNLGLSMDTSAIEDMILQMSLATGVGDDELRPAFERLVRSTKDTTDAQDLLALAMDISAGTGKPLVDVSNALAGAYDGNTGALKKLKTGLDNTTIASGDMKTITGKLGDMFAGQATSQAETWGGKLDRVKVAFGELQESFGAAFLAALDDANGKGLDITDTFGKLEPIVSGIGTATGTLAANLGNIATAASDAGGFISDSLDSWGKFGDIIDAIWQVGTNAANAIGNLSDTIGMIKGLLTGESFQLPGWLAAIAGAFGVPTDMGYRRDGWDLNFDPTQHNAQYAPGTDTSGDIYNQHGGRSRSRSLTVNVNTGVSDPISTAREVRRAVELELRRTG